MPTRCGRMIASSGNGVGSGRSSTSRSWPSKRSAYIAGSLRTTEHRPKGKQPAATYKGYNLEFGIVLCSPRGGPVSGSHCFDGTSGLPIPGSEKQYTADPANGAI